MKSDKGVKNFYFSYFIDIIYIVYNDILAMTTIFKILKIMEQY